MALANYDVSAPFLVAAATRSSITSSGQNLIGGFLLGVGFTSDWSGAGKSQVLHPHR
jgi:hypothetical protein